MGHDGYLVLGAAETVVGLTDSFRPVPERRGLFGRSKQPAESAPGEMRLDRLHRGRSGRQFRDRSGILRVNARAAAPDGDRRNACQNHT